MRTNDALSKLTRGLLRIDTRLLEIVFSGLCLTNGITGLLGTRHPFALFPAASTAEYSFYIFIGMSILFFSLKGIISNNCYWMRSAGMFVAAAFFVIIIAHNIGSGEAVSDNLSLIWLVLVCAFSSFLLSVKHEAIQQGFSSVRGSIVVYEER